MGIFSRRTRHEGVCACGHGWDAHEHYRRGTECSICDIRQCSSFTPVAADAAPGDRAAESDSHHHA